MFRLHQIKEKIIKNFLLENGRIPTDIELEKILKNMQMYAPTTVPMVPEKDALSNSDFIKTTLQDLVVDRDDINKLTEELNEKADRIQKSTIDESNMIIDRASSILTKYKDNDFKTIYNEVPILPDGADVYNYYVAGPAPYFEEPLPGEIPSYSSQYIDLDSYNVRAGKEGISLVRSAEEVLMASMKITSYSAGDPVFLQTINEVNPISITVRGTADQKKGINITFDIPSSTKISTLELDADSAQVEVWVDGDNLLSKSIDGKTTLIIGKEISDSLILRLYSTESIVPILIRNIKITKDVLGIGNYTSGRYVSLDLEVSSDYGDLLFKPDEYTPDKTSISWEYSAERLYWKALNKDEDGKYLPIDWNSKDHPAADNTLVIESDANDILTSLFTISEDDPNGIKVKMGKDAILFSTPELLGYYAFTTYLTPIMDSGYTLSIYNPLLSGETRLIDTINVSSEGFGYSAPAGETISVDLPAGTHKVELVLKQTDDFNLDEYSYDSKGILKVLSEDFLVDFSLLFTEDIYGQTVDVAIQPYSLTQTSVSKLNHHSTQELLDRFVLDAQNRVLVSTLFPGSLYDIVLLTDTYNTTSPLLIPNELHYFSGDGNSAWEVDMYHTPTGDVTFNDDQSTSTPSGATVTVPSSKVDTTKVEDYVEFLEYSGEDAIAEFTLTEIPTAWADTNIIADNLNTDSELLAGGTSTETITFAANEATPAAQELTYFPIISTITLVPSEGDTDAYTYVYDPSNNKITATREDDTAGIIDISLVYDYASPQDDDVELLVHNIAEELTVLYGGKITLTREPTTASAITVTFGTTSTGSPYTATLADGYWSVADVTNTGAEEGDKVFVEYQITSTSTLDGKTLTISNLPVNATTKKSYTDAATITNPVADSELVLTHPAYDNAAISDVTITVNDIVKWDGSAGLTPTLLGNLLTVDLSSLETDPQEPLSVYITYLSYEHEEPYKLRVEYDYYGKEPYTFSYTFNQVIPADMATVYSNSTMYNNFYDISYYTSEGACYVSSADGETTEFTPDYLTKIACEAADGSWHTSLFLKAELDSNGKDTPIIRRLRFDRQ